MMMLQLAQLLHFLYDSAEKKNTQTSSLSEICTKNQS